jgi:hypothetical protein
MIAAFGLVSEPEPGLLQIEDAAVQGVHITRLRYDGLGKAGTGRDKFMVGRSIGTPIVLGPPNDLLGLVITEGIEDGLSVHDVTGLETWAAGWRISHAVLGGRDSRLYRMCHNNRR